MVLAQYPAARLRMPHALLEHLHMAVNDDSSTRTPQKSKVLSAAGGSMFAVSISMFGNVSFHALFPPSTLPASFALSFVFQLA